MSSILSLRRHGRPDRDQEVDRLRLSMLLAATVAATLLPAVLFQYQSRMFLLKLGLAALLSVLPGWLYLLFIRFRGRSLYDEFVLNLFRLRIDRFCNLPAPPQHTSYYKVWQEGHAELHTTSKDNLYRRKFEAIYGQRCVSTIKLIRADPNQRDRTETFSPVLVATILLCLGWALVVQPDLFRAFQVVDGRLALPGHQSVPYETIQFGFLGAYWFILQDLIRRYFRDDLKTGAYISAAARILLVTVTVVTVSLIPLGSMQQQKVLAFLIGVFPQLGIQILKAAATRPFGRLIPTVKTEHPLSDLGGLTIWDEARLLEEGIEDMQNLVNANLVDLLLRSRVPVNRLVDWIDQACLYLRVPSLVRTAGGELRPRARLRELGIRTATDLERAWDALGQDEGFRRCLGRALGLPVEDAASTVRSILRTFTGEVLLYHVREFRGHTWLQEPVRSPDGKHPEAATVSSGTSLN
jgi:hypothetical protein